MFLHFPCKEFAEESGKTGLRADTPFLPAYHFTQSAAVCQRRIALWVKKIFRKSCGSCPLSHGFQPCQLSQRESQGAGFARPAQRKDNVLQSAQMARQWEFGGAAALGSPFGGAGERSETERAQAVANMGTVRRLQPGTLSVTAFSRASSPKGGAKGRAMPARRTEISAR